MSRVVDAHVHLWPVSRPERPYPWTPDPHPVEALLPVLDAAGVERAVQITPTIMGFDNDYGIEVSQRMPDRISVVGRFDATAPDLENRLKAWMSNPGADGVRLTFFGANSATPGILLGLRPFWEMCAELRVPVAVLAPDALVELGEVAISHPTLRLIVDHLGLGVYEGSPDPFAGWQHLQALATIPTLRIKISTLVETSSESFPYYDVHDRLQEAVELFGSHRLVWGSNYPVVLNKCSYRESLEFLGACRFLSTEDLEWITHGSWESFLGQA